MIATSTSDGEAAGSEGPPVDRVRRWQALVIPAALTLILALVFRQGMRATDDLGYAEAAAASIGANVAQWPIAAASHHNARIGAVLPLAGVFALFGPSNASLALLPLLCTISTAFLVAWLADRVWGAAVGLAAGLVFALLPLTIDLATFYVPEPLLGLESSVATVLFVAGLERQDRLARWMRFGAGLLIGVGYLTTEVGALLLPTFYIYLASARKLRPRDAWLAAGFLAVFCVELGYNASAHGNPLYRFSFSAPYSLDPMVQSANIDLAYRLFKAYPSLFIYPNAGLGLLGPLLIASGVYGAFKFREASLFVLWAAVIFLFFNFMSASFTHYVALPVSLRLIMPAFVPLAILAGKLLIDLWRSTRRSSSNSVRYLGAASCLAIGAVIACASALSMVLGTGSSLRAAIARNAEVAAAQLSSHDAVTVVSDPSTAQAIRFYRRFNPRDFFVPISKVDDSRIEDTPAFVVLNGVVINEAQIGGLYGAGFLPPEDRRALDRVRPPADAPVFSAHFDGGYPETLLEYRVTRYLLGSYGYHLVRMLRTTSPPLADIVVFRYDPGR